ncbi:NAD(P)-binding protein [Leucogyrophana mollusca]|uniref:NAD(P)-binding protein n=1 Tax=Leucogyrophana mollusca TaxID=85980 RepID=A0ACB8BL83_9AGAM|nr:NAD(P)-binding protein [Leucogyrophana mollusca]
MKVLVLGASGFIGLPVCQALCRAGHIVYGFTRSSEKAKQLEAEEIIPIVGEYDNTEPWVSLVSTIDAVIDTVGGRADLRTLTMLLFRAVREAAQTHRGAYAPKLTYIATSGTWVHGDNRSEVVSDTTPITNPVEAVAWRPAVEQEIISDSVLNGMVIRPGLLYGRSGSLLAPLFQSTRETGKVVWYGKPGGRYNLVHCDDLADLYVRAVEKGLLVGGKIFDVANPQTESVDDFLQKLVEVSGVKGPYEYIEASNAYEVALGTTTLLRPYLGRALLDWVPRKAGLIDGLPIYYAAWLAAQ